MKSNEKNAEVMTEAESLIRSRRKFIGASSAAVAAMIGLGAHAQQLQRDNNRSAEHDHSISNPGQENKVLLEQNPNSNTPPPSDQGDVGPIWYSFDLVHKRVQEGGWTHQVTQREFPSSREIAGVNMRLTAGSYRELHWHTADEWAYMLTGSARVTVMNPDGTIFIGDVNAGDLWVFPAGFPHSIQGTGDDGCEFLLVFPQGLFSEDNTFLISEWIAHTPTEVLVKNFGVDEASLKNLPTSGLYIFPGHIPGTMAADIQEMGGPGVLARQQYTFKMRSMPPTTTTPGGEVRVVDSSNFPASKNIAAALVIVKPGHIREMHWHPNASEWQFYIQGTARMTVFMPVGNARTMDYRANDVGFVPAVAGHYVENTGADDLVFLELFAADHFLDVSLNNWIRRLPISIVEEHLGLDDATIKRIPATKTEII
jgi:oxalate decarboxylase